MFTLRNQQRGGHAVGLVEALRPDGITTPEGVALDDLRVEATPLMERTRSRQSGAARCFGDRIWSMVP